MGLSSKRSVTPPFQGGNGSSNLPSPTKSKEPGLPLRVLGERCRRLERKPRVREPVVDTDAVGHMVIRSRMNTTTLPSEDSL